MLEIQKKNFKGELGSVFDKNALYFQRKKKNIKNCNKTCQNNLNSSENESRSSLSTL